MQKVLVTGAAGFIGFHTTLKLLENGFEVIGIDNINSYYDVNLKYGRLLEAGITQESIKWGIKVVSKKYSNYTFIRLNLEDEQKIFELFTEYRFDFIVHLAAQAGVRYSLKNPNVYIQSNINGFMNILEACRREPVKHLVYASSSSVYGANAQIPFNEQDNVNHPVSLYAATKKANELMAHSYSHLFKIPTTGLRFFTVYGPWGRPDMALFLFTEAIIKGKPLQVFNNGDMKRDFTFIDDIVEGVFRILINPLIQDKDSTNINSNAPYSIYNIGNSKAEPLLDFISAIEKATGKKASLELLPMQPGDVPITWANTEKLKKAINYLPKVGINDGIKKFVDWYMNYYIEGTDR